MCGRPCTPIPNCAGVLVQASETSTGVLHPVHELGAVTRGTDVLLVVDGISAVGISPCPMDAWGIDCLLTGSQKGLMLPPGLALLALSARAWDRVRAVGSSNFYFNLLAERDKSLNHQTLFTSPVNLLQGLAVSLDLFRQETLEAVYAKQWALTSMARTGAASLGLELLAKTHFTWGLTSIRLPVGIDGGEVLKVAARALWRGHGRGAGRAQEERGPAGAHGPRGLERRPGGAPRPAGRTACRRWVLRHEDIHGRCRAGL
jgi:aspartate aminotransferase-like enzyme